MSCSGCACDPYYFPLSRCSVPKLRVHGVSASLASTCHSCPSRDPYAGKPLLGRALKHLSFLGVLLVTRSDSTITTSAADTGPDLPSHPILGDLAALLSASFYAVYVVFLKVRVKDEERADMQLMLG